LQHSQQKQYSLTLLEGWNIWQVRDALQNDPVLEQTLQGVSDEDLMASIGANPGHPEGQFLPDTYLFPSGTTDAEYLLRAHEALQKTLDTAWQQKAEGLAVSDPYDVLILASIIEKETAVESERETISGVIANRLHKKMRDLQTKTPYNTYKIPALPPTPIAMPSTASINAAVNPADTKAIYFVADGTGGHVFNETLQDHERAVQEYLRSRKKKK